MNTEIQLRRMLKRLTDAAAISLGSFDEQELRDQPILRQLVREVDRAEKLLAILGGGK